MDMNAIIHTLITFIGIGLVFYYFRNRLAMTEQKVNLMFQLIQEHEKKSAIRPQFNAMPIIQSELAANLNRGSLISVSEDDSDESCSDNDSDEVSDDEKITYGETLIHGSALGTEKIITLELNGGVNSMGGSSEPYINNIVVLNNTDPESIGESEEEDVGESEEGEIVESEEEGIVESDDGVIKSGQGESYDGEILLTETPINYKKATVSQLKEICETKNLTGFKTMRKQALIELLEK